MQVRSLPALILPQRSTHAPQRAVAPVAAQDERSQPAPPVPRSAKRQAPLSEPVLQVEQGQRYSYTRLEAEGSRTSRALETYYNIETQDEQARSQALFGIDILA